MEDDNEITFRLPSATEPRYKLRRQHGVTETSANRTSSDGEIDSGTQKLSRRNVSTRKSRDSNTSASLESELRRINEHIEELKRHASRSEKLEGNPSRSSGFVEQPVPLGATCSNEPLATQYTFGFFGAVGSFGTNVFYGAVLSVFGFSGAVVF